MRKMDREFLQMKLIALLMDFFGTYSFEIKFDEDLRERQSWDENTEEKYKELILNEFDINVNLTEISPLTINNIVSKLQESEGGDV